MKYSCRTIVVVIFFVNIVVYIGVKINGGTLFVKIFVNVYVDIVVKSVKCFFFTILLTLLLFSLFLCC